MSLHQPLSGVNGFSADALFVRLLHGQLPARHEAALTVWDVEIEKTIIILIQFYLTTGAGCFMFQIDPIIKMLGREFKSIS